MLIYFVLAEHCVQLWQVLSQLRLTALFYRGYYHNVRKNEGGHLETKYSKKSKMKFLNSVTMPKNVKEGPFGIFNIHSVADYQNNSRGDSLV